jgi:hypothetical protein
MGDGSQGAIPPPNSGHEHASFGPRLEPLVPGPHPRFEGSQRMRRRRRWAFTVLTYTVLAHNFTATTCVLLYPRAFLGQPKSFYPFRLSRSLVPACRAASGPGDAVSLPHVHADLLRLSPLRVCIQTDGSNDVMVDDTVLPVSNSRCMSGTILTTPPSYDLFDVMMTTLCSPCPPLTGLMSS